MPANIRRLMADMYEPSIIRISKKLQRDYQLKCPWNAASAAHFQWPLWVRDVGSEFWIVFDRTHFVAREFRHDREVARHSYLGSLVYSLERRCYRPQEIDAELTARRLIELQESIMRDRARFLRGQRKDSALRKCQDQLAEMGANFKRLQQDHAARGSRIAELEGALIDRDSAIKRLLSEQVQGNSWLEQLQQDHAARGSRIAELEGALIDRDSAIKRLLSEQAQGNSWLEQLQQDHAARGSRIVELEGALVERDGRIEKLQSELAAANAMLREMQAELARRED